MSNFIDFAHLPGASFFGPAITPVVAWLGLRQVYRWVWPGHGRHYAALYPGTFDAIFLACLGRRKVVA